jgi:hypothetical protein
MIPRPAPAMVGWLIGCVLAGGLFCLPVAAEQADPVATKAGQAEAPAVPVAASVESDKTEAKLGEPVRLTIRVQGDSQPNGWRLPDSLDLGPFVELGRVSRTELSDGRPVQVFELRVAAFEQLGDLELTGIQLVSTQDGKQIQPLSVPPVRIKLLSILEGVAEPLPRDVTAPVDVLISDYRLLVMAGLVGLWLLLGLVLRRQRGAVDHDTRLIELPPPRQAHQIALERLQRILDADLLRKGDFHGYFRQISEVVREYLGNRYAFFALDLTSTELIAELRDRITPGLDLARLGTALAEADLVKFARLEPNAAMCSNAINSAYGMIEATRLPDEAQAGGVPE